MISWYASSGSPAASINEVTLNSVPGNWLRLMSRPRGPGVNRDQRKISHTGRVKEREVHISEKCE